MYTDDYLDPITGSDKQFTDQLDALQVITDSGPRLHHKPRTGVAQAGEGLQLLGTKCPLDFGSVLEHSPRSSNLELWKIVALEDDL